MLSDSGDSYRHQGRSQSAASDAPALEAVLAHIREWAANRQEADPHGLLVRGRVAMEIGSYLGEAGAQRVLEALEGGEKLIPTLESVLSIFLGCRAASKLTQRIVDTAIMRT